jgi:predicted nucleic acid-binding protein
MNRGNFMARYVVDTSVLVTRFHVKDSKHQEVAAWFNAHNGEEVLIVPCLLLVEISAAFKQCNIPREKRDKVLALIEKTFVVEDFEIADAHGAAEIAFRTGSRGCDSVFIAVAKEWDAILVTKDKRQAESGRASGIEVLTWE